MSTCRNCGKDLGPIPPVHGIVEVVSMSWTSDVTGERNNLTKEEVVDFCSREEARTWQRRSEKTFVRWVEGIC